MNDPGVDAAIRLRSYAIHFMAALMRLEPLQYQRNSDGEVDGPEYISRNAVVSLARDFEQQVDQTMKHLGETL